MLIKITVILFLFVLQLARRTQAFVQFTDYDMACKAFSEMDMVEFGGRPLRINFAYNTFAPEDVINKQLKNLRVNVKIENVDGE